MNFHPLDLFIFAISFTGAFLYGSKVFMTLVMTQQMEKDATAAAAAAAAESKLDVSCWVPSQFEPSQERYSQNICRSKFIRVLQGENATEHEIFEASASELPTDNREETKQQKDPFGSVKKIYMGSNDERTSRMKELQEKKPFERLYPVLVILASLSILSFAVAISFGRVAKSHTAFLDAAWRSIVTGPSTHTDDAASGDQGALLAKSGVIAARLEFLWSTKKLAVGYFLFQFVIMLLWVFMGIGCYHGSTHLTPSQEPNGKHVSNAATPADSNQSNHGEVAWQPKEDSPPMNIAGVFKCSFTIPSTSNVMSYVLQCQYDLTPAKKPNEQKPDPSLTLWLMVLHDGVALCLIVASLIAVHIVAFFFLAPLSRQKSLIPILKALEVKPKDRGLGFGFTDLNFVASFSTVRGSTAHMFTGTPGETPMKQFSRIDDDEKIV